MPLKSAPRAPKALQEVLTGPQEASKRPSEGPSELPRSHPTDYGEHKKLYFSVFIHDAFTFFINQNRILVILIAVMFHKTPTLYIPLTNMGQPEHAERLNDNPLAPPRGNSLVATACSLSVQFRFSTSGWDIFSPPTGSILGILGVLLRRSSRSFAIRVRHVTNVTFSGSSGRLLCCFFPGLESVAREPPA